LKEGIRTAPPPADPSADGDHGILGAVEVHEGLEGLHHRHRGAPRTQRREAGERGRRRKYVGNSKFLENGFKKKNNNFLFVKKILRYQNLRRREGDLC